MCGIAGVVHADGRPVDAACLRAMARLILHRGPDSGGFHEGPGVGLAHRRLAIIDPAHGQQPMTAAGDRYVIVYNGEVYNFRELRAELEARGRAFHTDTDTEVVLAAWLEWGLEALPRLNGMFALAIYDTVERELLLARDRLGIKPLYVARRGEDLVFGSEVKGMLPALPPARADLRTVFEFLTFQNVLGDTTFFEGVAKLPPGQWLRWTPRGVSQGSFWEVAFPEPDRRGFDAAVEEYRATLERAVRRHMIADVPVGAYLSGGFDSASVASLARRSAPRTFHTFTGAFTERPYYDERAGSRAVASRIGAEAHEVEITPAHYADAFADVVYHLDEPTLGTGAVPQYVVAELAARHVKVILTGHGGDECYAGYQVNKVALLQETWAASRRRLPRVLRQVRRDEWSRVLYFLLYPVVFPEVGHGLFIMTPRRRRRRFFDPALLEAIAGFEPLDVLARRADPQDSPGQRLMRLYLRTYLPTLFVQEDKLGMAHSLESRTPLCDNELIDLALRLPLETKLHGSQLKAVPKAAARDLLPPLLYELPKRGFPTPFQRWYRREPLGPLLDDLLLAPTARQRGVGHPEQVERLLRRMRLSPTDTLFDYARANVLYALSVVEQWFRTFVDRETWRDRLDAVGP